MSVPAGVRTGEFRQTKWAYIPGLQPRAADLGKTFQYSPLPKGTGKQNKTKLKLAFLCLLVSRRKNEADIRGCRRAADTPSERPLDLQLLRDRGTEPTGDSPGPHGDRSTAHCRLEPGRRFCRWKGRRLSSQTRIPLLICPETVFLIITRRLLCNPRDETLGSCLWNGAGFSKRDENVHFVLSSTKPHSSRVSQPACGIRALHTNQLGLKRGRKRKGRKDSRGREELACWEHERKQGRPPWTPSGTPRPLHCHPQSASLGSTPLDRKVSNSNPASSRALP